MMKYSQFLKSYFNLLKDIYIYIFRSSDSLNAVLSAKLLILCLDGDKSRTTEMDLCLLYNI